MNRTRKKIVAIITFLIYDLLIDLYHIVSQYISQFIMANKGNNAASDDDCVVKNSDGTLTCQDPPYAESDASDSEAIFLEIFFNSVGEANIHKTNVRLFWI